MKNLVPYILTALSIALGITFALKAQPTGQLVKPFTVKSTSGKTLTNKDLYGKVTLIYFSGEG